MPAIVVILLAQKPYFREDHFSGGRPVAQYGAKAKREMNVTMHVMLDINAWLISHEFGDDAGWGTTKQIPIDPTVAKGAAELKVRSTDFAFVLRQIADLDVIGPLQVDASEHAIRITFETSAMTYSVWIPACDGKGVRSGKCFERYHPVLSELAHDPLDDDVEDSEGLE